MQSGQSKDFNELFFRLISLEFHWRFLFTSRRKMMGVSDVIITATITTAENIWAFYCFST